MNRIAALGAKRLRFYFSENKDILEKYKEVLAAPPDDDLIKEGDELFDMSVPVDIKCSILLEYTYGNEIARTAFELAVLRYIEPLTGEILSIISDGNKDGVTLETAARVCGFGSVSSCIPMVNDAYERLKILLSSRNDKSDVARAVLKAEYPLICYMADEPLLEVDTAKFCREYIPEKDNPPAVYAIEDDVVSLADRLHNMAMEADVKESLIPITVVIKGERESGKGRALERIAYETDAPVLIADAEFLLKVENPRQMLRKLFLHCYLADCMLCIENIPKDKNTDPLIKEIRREYNYFGSRPLILLCEEGVKPLYYLEGRLLSMDIKKPDQRCSYLLWKGFLEEAGISDRIDPASIASKMNLNPGQIKRICDLITAYESSCGSFPEMKQIYQFCYEILDDGRYENIKQVESLFTLEDLKVDPKIMRALKDMCSQVEFRDRIYNEWGMSSKYEYGRCVSAIFAGPSGTGKTMAVHALSNELDLKLYKVDLSQLVDKYIGETEKRLEEVFIKAEKSHMILFFDEADAIMGKRSETKDSKDKYANTEIAYILQRIEEFDGIVILSTNYLQNIDQAFMRRIKYIIHFELPDEDTRREIWKSSFAPDVPLSDDIDWYMLAEKYKISGGQIKNIVLNAAFLAASDKKCVNMKHIMTALIRENSKDNKVTFSSDYGIYSHLVPRI